MELPEIVAKVIASAAGSGRKLSWKIQDSEKGTLVQLVWKSTSCSAGSTPTGGINWNKKAQRPRSDADAGRPVSTSQAKTRNTPSRKRRNALRREAFLEKKKLAEQEGVGVKTTPVPAIATVRELLEPELVSEPDNVALGGDSVSEVINLAKCQEVVYEMRDGKPGVKFTKGDEEGWTPVVRKCSRKKSNIVYSTHTHSQCVERCEFSGDEDLEITAHTRSVKYRVVDGTPGLRIRRGNTMSSVSWEPVVPTPIAQRTRTESKVI